MRTRVSGHREEARVCAQKGLSWQRKCKGFEKTLRKGPPTSLCCRTRVRPYSHQLPKGRRQPSVCPLPDVGIGQKWQIHTRRCHGVWNKPVVKRQRPRDPIYVRYLEGPKSQRDGRYRGCRSGVGEGAWGLNVSRVLSFSFARGKNSGMSSRDGWCGWCWWSRSVNGFYVPESCASNWLRWYLLRYMCVFYCNQNKTEQNADTQTKIKGHRLDEDEQSHGPRS